MDSLRRKLTAGYVAIAILLVAVSVFSILELRLVERKIGDGEKVAEFFDATLEVRRFEKNYLLYRQAEDIAEQRAYLARAQVLLAGHGELFASVAPPERIAALAASLDRYARTMEAYVARAAGNGGELLAADIRHLGKEIVTVAEELARAERRALQALLERHNRLLLASAITVVLLALLIGQLLVRQVVRALREIETRMAAVAAGKLARIEMDSEDREIVSLTQAFNHVLQELETRQGQLVRSEKLAALGTLLSGVAHELNNPLSNIATSTQILTEEGLAADPGFARELLTQIDEETWRARRIVRSLLDYARDRDFRRELVPLGLLVDDTLRLVRGRLPAQVAIAVDVPADLAVAGDRQRLQQVLFNLLGNAVEAMDGAGTVEIAAQRTAFPPAPETMVFGPCPQAEDAVEIRIADNGHGIAPEVLPRIFDPFFTTKEVGRGLGLGLFIVFEIVEEHGGCIAVDSAPGKGTTFRIRLPAVPEERSG